MPKLARQHRRRGSPWLTGTMRPSGGPLWNLAAELARLDGRGDDLKQITSIAGQFNARGASLASVASGLNCLKGKRLCVLVDQFEELFRFEKQTSREEAEVFVDLIVRAATSGDSPRGATDVHVVVTMRSEYLGECARFDGLAETINQTQYLVPRLDDDGLTRAVRRPAMLFGGVVDEELARWLIGPVRGRLDELPLLQHGLMQMWAEAIERTPFDQRAVLDGAIVEKAGGLAGLLSKHADDVTAEAAPHRAGAHIVENVFRQLTDVNAEGSAIRRPRRFADLAAATGASPEQLRPILDAFRAPEVAFLTPYAPAPIEAATEVDISHEALIRNWRRVASSKDGWLKQEFDDGLAWRSLLVEARAFEKNPNHLLPPAAADDRAVLFAKHNESWSHRYGGGWPLVGRLLDASRKAAARSRRWTTVTMASIAALAIVAAVMAAIMAVVLRKESEALRKETTAEIQAKLDKYNLQEALTRESTLVSQVERDKSSIQDALEREKTAATNLKAALTQEAAEENQLKEEEKRLTQSNDQSGAQINLTQTIFVQLTDAGRKCPNGITISADLLEKTMLAADRGNGNADFFLGMIFECGLGVAQSVPAAIGWHEKAAAAGISYSMWTLGIYYERGMGVPLNYVNAREWYEKAADAGDAVAMTSIGFLYDAGRGVSQNYEQARAWYEKAAAANEPGAMANLGVLFEDGLGVQRDIAKARELYEKAAAAGNVGAMHRLGALYALGKGVSKDKAKAQQWYQKAASAGDVNAKLDFDNFDFLPRLEAFRFDASTRNYVDAVRLEKELAREIEADERQKVRHAGPRTAQALGNLAFGELITGDFPAALGTAARAHQLAPDALWIEENFAHALAFAGSLTDAKKIYLSHRDEDDIGFGAPAGGRLCLMILRRFAGPISRNHGCRRSRPNLHRPPNRGANARAAGATGAIRKRTTPRAAAARVKPSLSDSPSRP